MTTPSWVRGGVPVNISIQRADYPLVAIVAACLLPYINLGPLSAPSQVQPWAGLLAWLWVGGRAIRSGVKVTGIQWILLIFATFFMLYVYGEQGFDPALYLRRSGAYLLSAGIFLAAQYATPATVWRALKITIPMWLFFAVLRYANSSIYYSIVTPLVPTVFASDIRGSSSLAPEATDFGFLMVFIVAFCMLTRQRLREQGLPTQKWPLIAAILCVVLSLSGMGYLGLAVILSSYLLASRKIKFGLAGRILITLSIGAIAVSVISILPTQSVRGVQLLRQAIQDPTSLMDTTISYRVVHGTVGALGVIDSGYIGYGAGSFQAEAIGVYYRHRLGSFFDLRDHYEINVPLTLSNNPSSQIAIILLEFGIIGIFYLLIVYGLAIRSKIPHKGVAVSVLMLAWLGSFPAAWPPFWLMIGLMMSPHFVSDRTVRDGLVNAEPRAAHTGATEK